MTVSIDREPAAPTRGRPAGVRMRRGAGLVASALALVVACALSLAIGAKDVPIQEVLAALFAGSGSDDARIVLELRVPRTLAGLAVGIALGVAGALMQALARNPLADPGILGVNAGAAFAVALAVGAFGVTTAFGYLWFALAGAFVVTIGVFVIGAVGRGAVDPTRLTLAGVAVAAVLTGVTSALMLLNPIAFNAMRHWNSGSLVERGFDVLLPVLPILGVGLLLALLSVRPLNAMGLGEDLASALGARVARTRVLVVVAVTLLAGGATAIAGPIVFLGLMVPHAARWIAGPDQRWILAYTITLAPLLMLCADIVGRLVLRPGEVPVGIVTAFLGAPILIALARRSRASAL